MKQPDEHVGGREDQRHFPKGVRQRRRRDQHRSHREVDQDARGRVRVLEGIGQPGIVLPRPPDRRQCQRPSTESGPRDIRQHQDRDLRHRVDVDEVEEQLKRSDRTVLVVGRPLVR
jgi:hypothetical protein